MKKRAKSKTETTTSAEKKKSFSARIGISSETLKPIFKRDKPLEGKLKSFHDTLNSRIKDGRNRALSDYRAWAAVDMAFKTPFTQVTPMILGNIMQKKSTAQEVLAELGNWGISEETLFTEGIGANGEAVRYINEETFYKILLPTVITYSEARWAKLYNDRDQFPLLKYEPFTHTVENALIGEALTNIFEKQGHQMGDRAMLRQAIKQGIKYATVLAFPLEAWYHEKSVTEDGDEYCVKEGLRYQLPHPTRMFWDLAHRPSTLNTDSGCDYAGYWRVMRWGDIKDNELYWNRDNVMYGGTDWKATHKHYFSEIYPCTMKFPTMAESKDTSREAGRFYGTSDHDMAVMVTDMFWKLIPKDWGLGDFKYPCWFRFVVAADDTVIFAEPLPYPAPLYLGLDVDENQTSNASFALKVVPFGVHMGNILSQIVLSLKQNATKVVVYDEKQLKESEIRALKSQSNDVSKIHFVPWDSTKARNAQLDPTRMLFPLQLPQQPIGEQTNTLSTFITVMERMLGISPAEVGASAVHVTTAEESRILSNNSSQRVDFSGTHIDDFLDAWKKQKYLAAMAFMDEEFITEISGNKEYLKILEELGFVLKQSGREAYIIKGEKSKLSMEAFVSVREGKSRINNPQIAQVLMQTIQVVSANPNLAQKIGEQQIINWVNRATQLAGGPRDAKFILNDQPDPTQQLQEMRQQLQQMQQALQEAQGQIQTDQIKAQTDMEKAQLNAQKDIEIQKMRGATSLGVAHIAATAKVGVSDHQAHDEAIALGEQQAMEAQEAELSRMHEAEMAEAERAGEESLAMA